MLSPHCNFRFLRLTGISFLLATASLAAPLPHDAYIWQRDWSPAVTTAITNSAPSIRHFIALGAEISFRTTSPTVVNVPAKLPNAGIALRIGSYRGDFNAATNLIATVAARLLRDHKPTELQIDFDCAESKLTGYRQWLTALRTVTGNTPLIITALPSWLRQPAFSNLVTATDGFVLQVHSLDASLTLCDPVKARQAVEQADRLGIPFRVALPTYGYLVATDPAGKLIGVSAETPSRNWPANARLHVARSDAAAMSSLVQHWNTHRPANLTGIIWYRLPIETDRLNWRWPTLAAIIAGRTPQANLRAIATTTKPGLVEISLRNDGDADADLPAQIEVGAHCVRPAATLEHEVGARSAPLPGWSNYTGNAIIACDALAGYDKSLLASNRCRLTGTPTLALETLAPGESRKIGWMRLQENKEAVVELSIVPP